MEKEKLQAIANLAKLRFEESQLDGMLTDFNKIMSYVDKVTELDTKKCGRRRNLRVVRKQSSSRYSRRLDDKR